MSSRVPVTIDLSVELGALFAEVGVFGYLHAVDLGSGACVEHFADDPVVLASVFKVSVLVELHRQADAGELDLTERVAVPREGRTEGETGLSVMRDPITVSLRDLASLMITVSDNTATDVLCDRVGVGAVNDTLRMLGYEQTFLAGSCRDLIATIREDLALADSETLAHVDLGDPAVSRRLRASDPLRTSRSTARETTSLLASVWADRVASRESCATMRRILGQQVWPHRLAAGFPEELTRTSGKTGTLPPWRNEAGVVETGNGAAYCVAVFTRTINGPAKDPAADAVIGRAARLAVDALAAR